MIIAIDGPTASGKGTIAKRVAAHYGFHLLDTGLLYRAVARAVLRALREETGSVLAFLPGQGEILRVAALLAEARLENVDIKRVFHIDPEAAWPRPGEALALMATTAQAQTMTETGKGNGGSPHVKSEWTVDGAKIALEYGRPSLKGRPEATMMPAGKGLSDLIDKWGDDGEDTTEGESGPRIDPTAGGATS